MKKKNMKLNVKIARNRKNIKNLSWKKYSKFIDLMISLSSLDETINKLFFNCSFSRLKIEIEKRKHRYIYFFHVY